jgi:hypothetical protein
MQIRIGGITVESKSTHAVADTVSRTDAKCQRPGPVHNDVKRGQTQSGWDRQPSCTASIEIEPPSNPSTGKLIGSSL